MAFPNSFELKFSKIDATPSKTTISVYVFRVTDGGTDAGGNQLYNRTLFQPPSGPQLSYPLVFVLDAGWDRTRIIAYFKQKIADWNTQYSLGYAAANQICTL